MIHALHGPPETRRRIAVIQIPRAQKSRLGWIRNQNWIAGPNTTALNSWTPVTDMMPVLQANSSSVTADEWQGFILQRQARAALQTPGTLVYTPAPPDPSGATIEAPWASWSTGDCNPDAGSLTSLGAPSPAAAASAVASAAAASDFAGSDNSKWAIMAAVLGAAASLVYLRNAARRSS